MRVLLDTNVLVRATARASGPARTVFLRLLDPPYRIVVSHFLLDELRRVMQYPRVQQTHGLSPTAIEQFVRDLASAAELVDVPRQLPFQVQYDPDDDPIVAAAVFGRAEILCTRDRHLRSPEVVEYCAQFGMRVLTDLDLLSELQT